MDHRHLRCALHPDVGLLERWDDEMTKVIDFLGVTVSLTVDSMLVAVSFEPFKVLCRGLQGQLDLNRWNQQSFTITSRH